MLNLGTHTIGGLKYTLFLKPTHTNTRLLVRGAKPQVVWRQRLGFKSGPLAVKAVSQPKGSSGIVFWLCGVDNPAESLLLFVQPDTHFSALVKDLRSSDLLSFKPDGTTDFDIANLWLRTTQPPTVVIDREPGSPESLMYLLRDNIEIYTTDGSPTRPTQPL